MVKVAIIGLGNRGCLYSDIIKNGGVEAEISAVCDINPLRLEYMQENYGVEKRACFIDVNEFFAQKRADVLVIATLDADHYAQALRAFELGYDVLLEKPVSCTLEECLQIEKAAAKYKRKAAVCHVLRYTVFYQKLKEVIDSGRIGKVITVNQTENVSYWHQAHSFVRGNWRKESETAPMILAKCCHDLDILNWLIGKDCVSVSSYGSLEFFNEANAPKTSAAHCFECGVQDTCPYNCLKFYKANTGWFNAVRTKSPPVKAKDLESEIEAVLSDKRNPYSRCVFKCDNDVVDHQVVNMLYEDGVTAHLTMTAFSNLCTRKIKVHGTYGEIEGDFEERCFYVTEYSKEREKVDITQFTSDFSGHGGGDAIMFKDFIAMAGGKKHGKGLTTLARSIQSHRMAFAAESSRLNDGKAIRLKPRKRLKK